MKHLSKFAFGVLALALASCSSDAPAPNNGNDADGDVYATLRVKLPSATRAGNAGQEYGQDSENYVSKILVVLTTKNESGDYIFLTTTRQTPWAATRLTPTMKTEASTS